MRKLVIRLVPAGCAESATCRINRSALGLANGALRLPLLRALRTLGAPLAHAFSHDLTVRARVPTHRASHRHHLFPWDEAIECRLIPSERSPCPPTVRLSRILSR